jgi:hypothetical protein
MFGSFFWPPGGLFAPAPPKARVRLRFRCAGLLLRQAQPTSTSSANIDMLSHHGATGPLQSLVDGCFSETMLSAPKRNYQTHFFFNPTHFFPYMAAK